jgi:hypothetical protein
MPLTPQDMLHKMCASIAERTGRSFEGWVELARAEGVQGHKLLTEHLKRTHGLNHNEAQWVAWEVTDPGRMASYDAPADLVDELYSGKKAPLRAVYERLLAAGLALGEDVTMNVCKTYTSLSAGTQFAILNPRTQSGVDVELALPADAVVGEPFTSSNPRFTRRLRVGTPDQVDATVIAALRAAAEGVRG